MSMAYFDRQQKIMDDKTIEALREENQRLTDVLRQAYAYIGDHRHGKARAVLFGALELYKQPATPTAGGEG